MDIPNSNIGNMTDTHLQKNGWNEWAKYVLMSLEELKKQYTQSEHDIEVNREACIQAINNLELTITKEMSELKSEIKVMKTKHAARAVAWSSIIPGIAAAILLILKLLG
jgi:hypothetical protein